MKKLNNYFAVTTATAILFVIASVDSVFSQSDTLKNTDSTNQQIVNAANPQTVNAQQSGAWTVGIDPTKNTVQLNNTPTNPLSVKIENAPTRTPFQKRVIVTPTGIGFASATLPIPAAKRLVIENVSVISRIPDGLKAEVNFFTNMNNGDGVAEITFHRFAMIEQGVFDGTAISVANNKVLVFADEQIGTNHYTVVAQARLNATATGFTQVQFTFSGYLEDLPTAP